MLILCCLQQLLATAQDTLPEFSVKNIGSNRYVISWTNNYAYTAQITIQRSFDSLSGYKSILSVPDPNSKQNGYADSKAMNDHMFYRLYILLDNGHYLFTKAKRPIHDTAQATTSSALTQLPAASATENNTVNLNARPVEKLVNQTATTRTQSPTPITEQPNGKTGNGNTENQRLLSGSGVAATNGAKEERRNENEGSNSTAVPLPVDQLVKAAPVVIRLDKVKTGDSARTPVSVVLQGEPNAYAPSLYVYTHPDGNIRIQVPNRSRLARYRIKFFEPDGSFLFELKNLPSPYFQLDKTNFLHSGWFHFELYEDNRLIERHKLYLE